MEGRKDVFWLPVQRVVKVWRWTAEVGKDGKEGRRSLRQLLLHPQSGSRQWRWDSVLSHALQEPSIGKGTFMRCGGGDGMGRTVSTFPGLSGGSSPV